MQINIRLRFYYNSKINHFSLLMLINGIKKIGIEEFAFYSSRSFFIIKSGLQN